MIESNLLKKSNLISAQELEQKIAQDQPINQEELKNNDVSINKNQENSIHLQKGFSPNKQIKLQYLIDDPLLQLDISEIKLSEFINID